MPAPPPPPPLPPQQLDIFANSRDVMLRNDVLDALGRRDAHAARAAHAALAVAYPGDADLPPFDALTASLEQDDDSPLPDHDAAARLRQSVTDLLTPAAHRALGPKAGEAWLRPVWGALAARSVRLPFDAAREHDHAAAMWLRGLHWAAAVQATQGIESWRRIPAPLAWMTEARCRLGDLDDCWPLIAELAWIAPKRLDGLMRAGVDPLLTRLHKRFIDHFDGIGDTRDMPWFPAWVLTHTPALAVHLSRAEPAQHTDAERGLRLMVELLGLERQGRHHELVQQRRALRDLHVPLYAACMATR